MYNVHIITMCSVCCVFSTAANDIWLWAEYSNEMFMKHEEMTFFLGGIVSCRRFWHIVYIIRVALIGCHYKCRSQWSLSVLNQQQQQQSLLIQFFVVVKMEMCKAKSIGVHEPGRWTELIDFQYK